MQLQQQARRLNNTEETYGLQDGCAPWGSAPVIYRTRINNPSPKSFTHRASVGNIYVTDCLADGRDYYYVVKEIKNGWIKLEWPD